MCRPVVLNGVSYIPPSVGINFSSWFLVGFIFQYVVRKRNFAWWSKFNYVTSAALDIGAYFHFLLRRIVRLMRTYVGTVTALIIIFFTLQIPKGGLEVNWWGNNVFVDSALTFLTHLLHLSLTYIVSQRRTSTPYLSSRPAPTRRCRARSMRGSRSRASGLELVRVRNLLFRIYLYALLYPPSS